MNLYAEGHQGPVAATKDDDKEYVPPVAMMAIVGFTHTQAPLSPPTDPYRTNDNVVLSPFSGLPETEPPTDNIGASRGSPTTRLPRAEFADPFEHTWTRRTIPMSAMPAR